LLQNCTRKTLFTIKQQRPTSVVSLVFCRCAFYRTTNLPARSAQPCQNGSYV